MVEGNHCLKLKPNCRMNAKKLRRTHNDLVFRITHSLLKIMTQYWNIDLMGLQNGWRFLKVRSRRQWDSDKCLRCTGLQTLTACVATQSVPVLCRPAGTDCLCRYTVSACAVPACGHWLLVSLHSQCLCCTGLQTLTACVATQSVPVLYRPADTDCLCRYTVSACAVPACRHWLLVSLHSQCLCCTGLRTLTACVATQSMPVLCRPADTDCFCRYTVSACAVPACRYWLLVSLHR